MKIVPFEDIERKVKEKEELITSIKNEIEKHVFDEFYTEKLLISLLTGEHIIVFGPPGSGKTFAPQKIGELFGLKFSSIPLSSKTDWNLISGKISQDDKLKVKGILFSNIAIFDCLEEADISVQNFIGKTIEENKVKINGFELPLNEPFLAVFTVVEKEEYDEHISSYLLDRIAISEVKDYGNSEQLLKILNYKKIQVNQIKKENLIELKNIADEIYIDERLKKYVSDIVSSTRNPVAYLIEDINDYIEKGVSHRTAIHLLKAAKAKALLSKRGFVIPEDIQELAYSVLRHRIKLTYKALKDGITKDKIIEEILTKINHD